MHLLRLELPEDSSQSLFPQTRRREKAEIATAPRKEKEKGEDGIIKAKDVDEDKVLQDVEEARALERFHTHRPHIHHHDLLDDEQRKYPSQQTQILSVSAVV